MIPSLHQIVGLPPSVPVTELACAADEYSGALFARAANGDSAAQRQLVELQVAYMIWAYAGKATPCSAIRRRYR